MKANYLQRRNEVKERSSFYFGAYLDRTKNTILKEVKRYNFKERLQQAINLAEKSAQSNK